MEEGDLDSSTIIKEEFVNIIDIQNERVITKLRIAPRGSTKSWEAARKKRIAAGGPSNRKVTHLL